MNRIILCFALMTIAMVASAQKIYFIYVQAESGQAFYVKMEEKVYSSTASGYLILSKLKDSTQNFSIGFPGNKWPEQKFSVTMDRKDHGFLLKNFGDKGWGLFDLQTLAILMGVSADTKKDGALNLENKEASDFTKVLSKAADDPSLKENPVRPKPDEPRPVVVKTAPEKSPEVVKTETVSKPPADPAVKEKTSTPQEEPGAVVVTQPVEKVPVVVKTEPVKNTADNSSLKEKPADSKPAEPTIVAVVPAPDKIPPVIVKTETVAKPEPSPSNPTVIKEETKQDPPKDPVAVNATSTITPKEEDVKVKEEPPVSVQPSAETEKPVEYKVSVITRRSESSTTEGFGLTFTDSYTDGMADTIRILIPNPKPVVVAVVPEKQEPREEKRFLDTETSPTTIVGEKKTEPVIPGPTTKNQCAAVADENDVSRIRKKMTVASSDEKMIAEASRVFKTKCFTSSQVKELGKLFYDDKGRYRFFDAAYPYVSDAANFPSLEAELKDTYYVNRFKAMIR